MAASQKAVGSVMLAHGLGGKALATRPSRSLVASTICVTASIRLAVGLAASSTELMGMRPVPADAALATISSRRMASTTGGTRVADMGPYL